MARITLSSKIMDEVDRARKALSSAQDSAEPIIGALLDPVQECLQRIETYCLSAKQSIANALIEDKPVVQDVVTDQPFLSPKMRSRGTHKAPRGSKEA
jgi:hypothetical protein